MSRRALVLVGVSLGVFALGFALKFAVDSEENTSDTAVANAAVDSIATDRRGDPARSASPELSPDADTSSTAAKLDVVLRSEATDAVWAAETESAVTALFDDGSISGGSLSNLQCGSSLCRIDIKPERLSPQALITKVIHARGPFATGGHYSYDEESGEMRFYVRRAKL